MKIVVLSLLRIGDIVMQAPILKGLRQRYPDARIDLVINSQFKQITALLPFVDRVIEFDRERIQKGLGEIQTPFFEPYERLSSFFDGFQSETYDLAINLTHNRLSGWMMSLISARSKEGLCFDGNGVASFGSPWFRYLNNQAERDGRETFHFIDLFKFALNLDETSACLAETERGKSEAEAFLSGRKRVIAVQTLTSDVKKDWGLSAFAQCLKQVHNVHPSANFAILAAPFERERLEPFVNELIRSGIKAELAVLSFEGAFSLLKRSSLLLTGDTSIKHLAAAASTPVVELSIGSSDLYRTGVYGHNSLIIQTKEACAPCVHSRPCHQKSHLCAKRISSDAVAMIVSELFAQRTFQIANIAQEYADDIEVFVADNRPGRFWSAVSVSEAFTEANIGRWVDLTCQRVMLSAQKQAALGTEIQILGNFLRESHGTVSAFEWQELFSRYELQAEGVRARLNGLKVGLEYLKGRFENPEALAEYKKNLQNLRERIRHQPFFASMASLIEPAVEDDRSAAFTQFRRFTDVVRELDIRTNLFIRIVRGLRNANSETKEVESR